MKLQFLKAKTASGKVKCTIHKTGKLGFSNEAAMLLGLDENKYVKIAVDLDDENSDDLFLSVTFEKDEEAFNIRKAGQYYYLNTKYLFNELDIDFRKKIISYDIQEIEIEGETLFKLFRKEDRDRNK